MWTDLSSLIRSFGFNQTSSWNSTFRDTMFWSKFHLFSHCPIITCSWMHETRSGMHTWKSWLSKDFLWTTVEKWRPYFMLSHSQSVINLCGDNTIVVAYIQRQVAWTDDGDSASICLWGLDQLQGGSEAHSWETQSVQTGESGIHTLHILTSLLLALTPSESVQ